MVSHPPRGNVLKHNTCETAIQLPVQLIEVLSRIAQQLVVSVSLKDSTLMSSRGMKSETESFEGISCIQNMSTR